MVVFEVREVYAGRYAESKFCAARYGMCFNGLVNDQTLKVIAERYLGSATCEDYVNWAIACLETDVDSKNIRILSSLRKPLYSSEVDDYFERSLADLGWIMPERPECLQAYLRHLAQQVVTHEMPPLEASWKIYRVVVALDFPKELQPWMYLDGGLDPSDFSQLEDWDQAVIREAERLLKNLPAVRER